MKENLWPNSIFCNLKNGQTSIFELGKSLKLLKMQIHVKKYWFIWFHEFFCLNAFKFFGPLCAIVEIGTKNNNFLPVHSKRPSSVCLKASKTLCLFWPFFPWMEKIFRSLSNRSRQTEKYSTQAQVEKNTMHFWAFFTKSTSKANFWDGSSIIV